MTLVQVAVPREIRAPLAGIVLTHTAIFTHSYGLTENVRKMFESYVDPRIVQVIMEDESLWNELGGREQVITAFFSDIAGFTTLSELLGAHELSEMLTATVGIPVCVSCRWPFASVPMRSRCRLGGRWPTG